MSALPNDIISRIIREAPGAKEVHIDKMGPVFGQLEAASLDFWWNCEYEYVNRRSRLAGGLHILIDPGVRCVRHRLARRRRRCG